MLEVHSLIAIEKMSPGVKCISFPQSLINYKFKIRCWPYTNNDFKTINRTPLLCSP